MASLPPPANALLASLPADEWRAIRQEMQSVPLVRGDTLAEAGEALARVHFPVTGVVSMVNIMHDGATFELATAGREGVAEIGAVLGGPAALARHLVQVPGVALALNYRSFRRLEQALPRFRQALMNFMQGFCLQVMQSAGCNAHHSVTRRAARWLLTCDDRAVGQPFILTHELLAEMLGVSRPIVSTILRNFLTGGLIQYRRGNITMIDRRGLEQESCECYRIIRGAFEERGIYLSKAAA